MSNRSILGTALASVARRSALLQVLGELPERVEVSDLLREMERRGHSDLIGDHGRYDKLHADLVFLEKRGLVDRQFFKRDGLPGRAARWTLAG